LTDPRAWPPPVGCTVVWRNGMPVGKVVGYHGALAFVMVDDETFAVPTISLRIVPRPEPR
jgi:hypothetical protein